MAKRVSLDVTGVNETLERIRNVGKSGLDANRAVVAEVAQKVHNIATSSIDDSPMSSIAGDYPKSKSGRLRSSIKLVLPGGSGRAVALVGSDALHARLLEHGTASMAARPWLLPSFERGIDGVAGDLKAEFESRL